jgi:hypothetical protein
MGHQQLKDVKCVTSQCVDLGRQLRQIAIEQLLDHVVFLQNFGGARRVEHERRL